jgi:hypothetical protein
VEKITGRLWKGSPAKLGVPEVMPAKLIGITIAGFGVAVTSLQAQTYNPATQFSIANGDPNGVWSYGTLSAIWQKSASPPI